MAVSSSSVTKIKAKLEPTRSCLKRAVSAAVCAPTRTEATVFVAWTQRPRQHPRLYCMPRDAHPFSCDHTTGEPRPNSASHHLRGGSVCVIPSSSSTSSPSRSFRRPISASQTTLRMSTSGTEMLTLLHHAEPAGGASHIANYRKRNISENTTHRC